MSDLRDLYQDLILDHGKRPRNFRIPDGCNCQADGYNPLCGDKVSVYLHCDASGVVDIGIQGSGCAICMASASTMTEVVKGKSKEQAQGLYAAFTDWVVRGKEPAPGQLPAKLAVFSGVREFPMRVKCATLAWHTLKAALEGQPSAISEEE
jgi:nitrogen fixation protein NifU and related proteins